MAKKRKQQPQETPEQENISVRDAVFGLKFLEDLAYWVEFDRKVALRLLKLVEAIVRDPFAGIGKPEPLKYLDAGVVAKAYPRT